MARRWLVFLCGLLVLARASARIPVTRTEWYRKLHVKTDEVKGQLKDDPTNEELRETLVEHYEEYCAKSLMGGPLEDQVHPESLMIFLRLCRREMRARNRINYDDLTESEKEEASAALREVEQGMAKHLSSLKYISRDRGNSEGYEEL